MSRVSSWGSPPIAPMPAAGGRFPASIAQPIAPRRHIRCAMNLRPLVLVTATAALLAAAPPAGAKEISALRVCGPARRADRPAAVRATGEALLSVDPTGRRPARPERFVRLTVTVAERGQGA